MRAAQRGSTGGEVSGRGRCAASVAALRACVGAARPRWTGSASSAFGGWGRSSDRRWLGGERGGAGRRAEEGRGRGWVCAGVGRSGREERLVAMGAAWRGSADGEVSGRGRCAASVAALRACVGAARPRWTGSASSAFGGWGRGSDRRWLGGERGGAGRRAEEGRGRGWVCAGVGRSGREGRLVAMGAARRGSTGGEVSGRGRCAASVAALRACVGAARPRGKSRVAAETWEARGTTGRKSRRCGQRWQL